MNITYTKELHDSIKNSDDEFVKEQYKLDHKKNAAKLSLYYAHGNSEKNEINFDNATANGKNGQLLDKKAVKALNLANNTVLAAKQALVDSGKATSNVSSAAASMQIAANAVTKLSSDVAAMLAIASPSSHDSKIEAHVQRAHAKIKKAARLAEEVSLVSLKATIEAAQSTASTVVTDAEAALSSVTSLQANTSSHYSSLSELIVSANSGLTAARKIEKLASATLDIASKKDKAIKSTRRLVNKVSNSKLELQDPVLTKLKHPKRKTDISVPNGVNVGDSYTISFDHFENEPEIKNYRLIMVKYDEAEAFDLNIAKDLEPGTYCQVAPTGANSYSRTFFLLGVDLAILAEEPDADKPKKKDGKVVMDQSQVRNIAVDYRGKPIERGVYYVAFVHLVYQERYQHQLNSTEGYLSLPSKELILQNQLYATPMPVVHHPYFNSRNFAITFDVPLRQYNPDMTEFRIIMLESKNVKANHINIEIKEAIDELEKAEYKFNVETQKLDELLDQYNELEIKFSSVQNRITEVKGGIESDETLEDLQKKLTSILDQQTHMRTLINGSKNTEGQVAVVNSAKKDYQNAVSKEAKKSNEKVSDFIFDTELMGIVSPANYHLATPIAWDMDTAFEKWEEAALSYISSRLSLTELIKEKQGSDARLEAAKDAVSVAELGVLTAKQAVEEAEAALDASYLPAHKTTTEDSDDQDPIDYTKALKEAVLGLLNAQDTLHEKEKELSVTQVLHDNAEKDLTPNVDKFLESKFKMSRMEEIMQLLSPTLNIEDHLESHGFTKEKGRVTRSKKPAKAKEESGKDKKSADQLPQKITFYTELGEDATDNYGEPLVMNQANFMKEALQVINQAKDVDKALDELSVDSLLKHAPKNRTSYQAVVLTALTADNVGEINEYKQTNSEYSEANALYQV